MTRRSLAFGLTVFVALVAGCGSGERELTALEKAAQRQIALGKSAATTLEGAGSCSALEARLKALAAAEIETRFAMWNSDGLPVTGGGDTGNGAPPPSAPQDDGAGEAPGAGDHTNNQVAGVDEADFVKTDGTRLYVLEGNALHRFDIPTPGQIVPVGRIAIDGVPAAMLMDGTRVLVISSISNGASAPGTPDVAPFMLPDRVKTTLLDWPDDGEPTVIAERWFDGAYLTAREIDARAHLVLHGRLPNAVTEQLWQYNEAHDAPSRAKAAALEDLDALTLDALLPRAYVKNAAGDLDVLPYTEDDCAAFEIPRDSNGSGVTSLVTLDLDAERSLDLRHIVSNFPVVYVSANHLFLAERAQDWWWNFWEENDSERLNVHAFRRGEGGTSYLGSGRVEGAPINQFAMDEHEGVLRIATWVGGERWWWMDRPVESRVHALGIEAGALPTLGTLTGIAPGEQLHAARFTGDVAYLVTFEQIDPLFTLDLADPANPAIIGELKIPGFSTYLHPIADDRLLAVGIGGDESGATWQTVVSLFDVGDLAHPALLASHDFHYDNSGWNWSEALYEHKAFQFNATRGLLAMPFSTSRNTNGTWEWISTLELVEVQDEALRGYGSIDHSTYFDSNDVAYAGAAEIRRSFFIGDFIYAISSKAVTVHAAANPAVTVADALIDTGSR